MLGDLRIVAHPAIPKGKAVLIGDVAHVHPDDNTTPEHIASLPTVDLGWAPNFSLKDLRIDAAQLSDGDVEWRMYYSFELPRRPPNIVYLGGLAETPPRWRRLSRRRKKLAKGGRRR